MTHLTTNNQPVRLRLTQALHTGVAVGVVTLLGGSFSQAAFAAGAPSSCAPESTASAQVVAAMNGLMDAFRHDSEEQLRQVTMPDFYAYDAGLQLTGPALLDLIKKGHASGKRWEWSVSEPKVHVSCNLAWITYVNRGAIVDSSGRQEATWLESAVLQYSNAQWRVQFVHSTRAASKPT